MITELRGVGMSTFVSYLRVSTTRQGVSGLGIEAQRARIEEYVGGIGGEIVREYVEIESGSRDNRPVLSEALRDCRRRGAVLVVAKLDRLARSVAFISKMLDSGADFCAVDFPECNRFMLQILSCVAEYERSLISERTKAALAARKARGLPLGRPDNLGAAGAERGRVAGRKARTENADAFALDIGEEAVRLRATGETLAGIAGHFNAERIRTARGLRGAWTPSAVRRVILRYQSIDLEA
jgi:DNA invertase Pin-like site-specific DNA recombinase